MSKYTRETIYNSDGSIRRVVHTKDSHVLYGGVLDEDSSPMQEGADVFIDLPDLIDPIDPEVKFAEGQHYIVEREEFTIGKEKQVDLLGLAKQALVNIFAPNVEKRTSSRHEHTIL